MKILETASPHLGYTNRKFHQNFLHFIKLINVLLLLWEVLAQKTFDSGVCHGMNTKEPPLKGERFAGSPGAPTQLPRRIFGVLKDTAVRFWPASLS